MRPAGVAQPAATRRRLGTLGYLSCLAFSLAVAMLAQGWAVAVAAAAALLLALAAYPAGFRPLASGRLWLLVALLVAPAALLGGPPTWPVWGVALSRPGLASGLQMALRAVAIVVAVAGFAASVAVSELAGLLEQVGLKGLGFALGVAMSMLPVVRRTAITSYQALRLRGGIRRRPLRAARLLLITVVANSLRHADDIVSAAEARAFSAARARPLPVSWRWGDLALALALTAAAVALQLLSTRVVRFG